MKRVSFRQRVSRLLLAGLLAFCAGRAAAEVSVRIVGDQLLHVLMMISVEDPDPVGSGIWDALGIDPSDWVLNPDGSLRGDGPPDIFWSIEGDRLIVTWAYGGESDHDIVVLEWSDGSLSDPSFLTFGGEDELDPRIFVEPDGTAHLTWWSDGVDDTVFLATRPAGAPAWELPRSITPPGTSARRPTVAVWNGALRVAYEAEAIQPAMAQRVVVVRQESDGAWIPELSVETSRTERLDPVLHVAQGRLWLDWKHGANEFASAEALGSSWSTHAIEPWSDASWIGVESTRRAIRSRVLAP